MRVRTKYGTKYFTGSTKTELQREYSDEVAATLKKVESYDHVIYVHPIGVSPVSQLIPTKSPLYEIEFVYGLTDEGAAEDEYFEREDSTEFALCNWQVYIGSLQAVNEKIDDLTLGVPLSELGYVSMNRTISVVQIEDRSGRNNRFVLGWARVQEFSSITGQFIMDNK